MCNSCKIRFLFVYKTYSPINVKKCQSASVFKIFTTQSTKMTEIFTSNFLYQKIYMFSQLLYRITWPGNGKQKKFFFCQDSGVAENKNFKF